LELISGRILKDINLLLRNVSRPDSPSVTSDSLDIFFSKSGAIVIALDEEKIIGMASLVLVTKVNGRSGRVEHVSVLPEYAGKGVGREMMRWLIEEAKRLQLRQLDLTTEPSCKAVNALYQKLGFIKRKTNHYRLLLQ
jgi:ribosomal protein S18 acetylase RimI-like enzyme